MTTAGRISDVHIIGPDRSGDSDLKGTMGVLEQKASPPDSLMKLRININKICIEISFFSKGSRVLLVGKAGPTGERRKKPRKTC